MTLAMLHLPLDLRALMAASREHALVKDHWAADLGYLVHALLARLFDGRPPQPFDVQEPAGGGASELSVLAYTTEDVATLRRRAEDHGCAPARVAVDWQRFAAKEMPTFAVGQELGFRVRVCPVVRVGKHHPAGFRHGAEVDPYHNLLWRELALRGIARGDRAARSGVVANLPSREAVYRDWVEARLAPAATLLDARLTALRDARLWRRGEPGAGPAATMHEHERRRGKGAVIGRREALFEGRLRVTDADAFQLLLARGVGRHRAFGFGMLLVRPPAG